jgi:hypothetical protein
LTNGFLQELGASQRMLDEFNDDILFLAYGVISGDATDAHREYLAAFFQEEFDVPPARSNLLKSVQWCAGRRSGLTLLALKGPDLIQVVALN